MATPLPRQRSQEFCASSADDNILKPLIPHAGERPPTACDAPLEIGVDPIFHYESRIPRSPKIRVAKSTISTYRWRVIQAAIFDLDGTLVDSLPGIAASLNRALASRGHDQHDLDAVRSFIGNGSWMLCRRGVPAPLPDSEADAVNKAFMEDYNCTWLQGTELYSGIADLLAMLKKKGMPLAVLSNKPHSFTTDIVASLFAPGTFDQVLGHREGTEPKPDPAGALEIAAALDHPPSNIAFIGDSLVDLETANNAGMKPRLVSWGYRPLEELSATGEALLHSVPEILEHLQASA